MYILGISGGGVEDWAHNPSACLLKNGDIIAAAEEERFNRIKYATGCFPKSAIKFCLRKADITLEDIEHIGFYLSSSLVPSKVLTAISSPSSWRYALSWVKVHRALRNNFLRNLSTYLEPAPHDLPERVSFIEHHVAHAASSFRVSGFDDAGILSFDGSGELATTLLALGTGNEIIKIRETLRPHSLGRMWGGFTEYLGFSALDGPGKLMGMAAYGTPKYDLSDIVQLHKGRIHLGTRYLGKYYGPKEAHFYGARMFSNLFLERFGPYRKKDSKVTQRHADLAASFQKTLEDIALKIVNFLYETTGVRNLCVAGGVGLNCQMNSVMLNSQFVDNIFIQPAAHDAGTALGAALEVYARLGYKSKIKMEHAYFGPSFSNEEILENIRHHGLASDYYDDIAGITGELISKGNIVGFFQGEMEWGPRALGNRSILADPTNPKMKDKVNQIKRRESFRPFAPSITAEATKEYFEDDYPSPFMLLAFMVKEEKKKEIPAVVHVDGTVRSQTVEKRINPIFYRVIKSFEDKTSIPAILNTSFNVKGEPIVCSPTDAINTFLNTKLDYLAMGNYLIKKSA